MRKLLVIFVCTGNQCRSPMAEYLLKHRLGPRSKWTIESAGTSASEGSPASGGAIAVLKEKGIDMTLHRARLLTRDMVDSASFVIAMASGHREEILRMCPKAEKKIFLMKSFGVSSNEGDVDDPAGMTYDTYRRTRDEIDGEMADLILFLHEHGGVKNENRDRR